ncbi:N-acetylmuramoyl-L-alanine amidase [Pelagovum pacificum]|uniref:N-acetylmuramoyl-L-alanine amidase n=1 Tax=Pelagovum pacificum TaxID=2588711 RepID=A0A5C5GDQ6_9RHOB|nr:N-acetylmuramoyl-L-alanine amidase [Pelagovum pacificum]QQA44735.1 N-acetylmuramoyl-L-alanine amidase [Pelagovum pacificum]TNY32157.1 N-acetylmuramoyl-L-alanine amidase [Pelagovum pacificum]
MIRLALALLLALAPFAASAQDFTALARFAPADSGIRDIEQGVEITLDLSQPVPWRVFTLDEPRRLVLDFREVDWGDASGETLLDSALVEDMRMGRFAPGWSRMVLDLRAPLIVDRAGMRTDAVTGNAVVTVRLTVSDEATYAAKAGAPQDEGWDRRTATIPAVPEPDSNVIVVAIDPGHGGVDPGAQRDGVTEADLMLRLALELAEGVSRAGMIPVLTRTDDTFVPLQTRMTIARTAGANLFLSLHADALEEGRATGASIYTLSDGAGDDASERLAERHDRGDLLGGLDLSGQDDTVATILMDLARLETGPSGQRLAAALKAGLDSSGVPLNSRPRRTAMLAVLQAADFPSALIEAGFLSTDSDRDRLLSEDGRAKIVDGLVRGIQNWAAEEAALAPLIRQ